MPKFEPTDEQRNVVECAAGFGLPQAYICQLIVSERTGKPISLEMLKSVFRAELDRGMAQAHYDVAKSLYDQAVAGNVTAAIWFTKTQMGWSETTNVNVSEQSALAGGSRLAQVQEPECAGGEARGREEWAKEDGDDYDENSLHFPRRYMTPDGDSIAAKVEFCR